MPCDLVKMGLTPDGVCKHRYGELLHERRARYLLTANREQYEVLFPQVEGSRYFRQLFQMVKAISQLFRTDTHYHTRLGSTKVRVRIWIWKKCPVKGSRRNALR